MSLVWEYNTTFKTKTLGVQTGHLHKVEIIDTYGGVSGTFCGTDDGARLRQEGKSRSPWQTVQSMSCTFTMIIENDNHIAFIDALANFDEKRFFVKYYRGGVHMFTGVILTDAVVTEFGNKITSEGSTHVHGRYTVVAVDGITLLKDIAYNQDDGSAYLQPVTPALIMGRILAYMPTANQGQKQKWLTNWSPDTGGGTNFADNVAVPGITLLEESRNGGYEFFSAWDILLIFCNHWDIRIYYTENDYWFEQMNARATANSIYSYSFAGTYEGIEGTLYAKPFTIDCDNRWVISPDRRTRKPPLRTVTTAYDYRVANNILTGNKWEDQTSTDGEVCFTGLGPVPIPNATTRLTFRGTIEFILTDIAGNGFYRPVFFFKIKLGAQYYVRPLLGTDYFDNYQIFDTEEWTASSGYYVLPFINEVLIPGRDLQKLYEPFYITTYRVPIALNLEDIEICLKVELYDSDNNLVNPATEVELKAWLKDGDLKVIDADDNIVEQTTIVTTIENNVNNSKNIVRDKLRFSDGPSYGETRLRNDTLTTDTTEWTSEQGTFPHYETLARTVMARGMQTQEFFEGEIEGDINAQIYLLRYDSKQWIFLTGEYISGYEKWRGEWFNLQVGDASGLSKIQEDVFKETGGPNGFTISGGAGLRPLCRVVTGVQKNIDMDAINLPFYDTTNWPNDKIAAHLEVYKQGVGMLRYVDSATGVDEYYWDNATREVVLGEQTRVGDWTKIRIWI